MQRFVPALDALSADLLPGRGPERPCSVQSAERKRLVFGSLATHALVADIVRPTGAAGDEGEAHYAVGADRDRCPIEEKAKRACLAYEELDQVFILRIRRRLALELFPAELILLLFPVALEPGCLRQASRCVQ